METTGTCSELPRRKLDHVLYGHHELTWGVCINNRNNINSSGVDLILSRQTRSQVDRTHSRSHHESLGIEPSLPLLAHVFTGTGYEDQQTIVLLFSCTRLGQSTYDNCQPGICRNIWAGRTLKRTKTKCERKKKKKQHRPPARRRGFFVTFLQESIDIENLVVGSPAPVAYQQALDARCKMLTRQHDTNTTSTISYLHTGTRSRPTHCGVAAASAFHNKPPCIYKYISTRRHPAHLVPAVADSSS